MEKKINKGISKHDVIDLGKQNYFTIGCFAPGDIWKQNAVRLFIWKSNKPCVQVTCLLQHYHILTSCCQFIVTCSITCNIFLKGDLL